MERSVMRDWAARRVPDVAEPGIGATTSHRARRRHTGNRFARPGSKGGPPPEAAKKRVCCCRETGGGRPAQYGCWRPSLSASSSVFREQTPMRILSALRASLIALPALAGAAFGSAAYADSGGISFSVIKAGLVIGGSAGSGTLTF